MPVKTSDYCCLKDPYFTTSYTTPMNFPEDILAKLEGAPLMDDSGESYRIGTTNASNPYGKSFYLCLDFVAGTTL